MTATLLLVFAAGLIGAAGVALAALGAHAHAGTALPSAAMIALVHAPSILAVAVARKGGLLHDGASRIGAFGLAAGVILFSGDIAARVLGGHGLFPMAAPTGGTILIIAWLTVALSALGVRDGTD